MEELFHITWFKILGYREPAFTMVMLSQAIYGQKVEVLHSQPSSISKLLFSKVDYSVLLKSESM